MPDRHPPNMPYELWWCGACGEPCVNGVSHDPTEHPGGCGGPVTTYLLIPGRVSPGSNGKRWIGEVDDAD